MIKSKKIIGHIGLIRPIGRIRPIGHIRPIRHILLIGLIGLMGLINPVKFLANAQTAPQFLVSWKSGNFVPADYSGKILPIKGSKIEMGFDLIDKGKVINLSNSEISWYANGELIARANGLKTANRIAGNRPEETIRISISDYQGAELEKTFLIPITNPEAILDIHAPTKITNNQFGLGLSDNKFEARPFFFNISDPFNELSLSWKVNNNQIKEATDKPILELDLTSEGKPQQTNLNLSVEIRNKLNQLELAIKSINFIVK